MFGILQTLDLDAQAPMGFGNLGVSVEAKWLKKTFPILRDVHFTYSSDDTFMGGRFQVPMRSLGFELPTVILTQAESEKFEVMKSIRRDAIVSMAKYLGCGFDDIRGSMIRSFILFHEAGHAVDFMTNFYQPLAEDREMASVSWKTNSSLQFQTLPIPNVTPRALQREISMAGGFQYWLKLNRRNRDVCRRYKVGTGKRIYQLQEAAYRALNKESFADRFAAQAFKQFYSTAPSEKLTLLPQSSKWASA